MLPAGLVGDAGSSIENDAASDWANRRVSEGGLNGSNRPDTVSTGTDVSTGVWTVEAAGGTFQAGQVARYGFAPSAVSRLGIRAVARPTAEGLMKGASSMHSTDRWNWPPAANTGGGA